MEITARIRRDPGQLLGIGFRSLQTAPFCQVAKILETGAAHDSALCEGDLLLAVNEVDVQNMDSEAVRTLLSSGDCAGPELTFRLHRPGMNGMNGMDKSGSSRPSPHLADVNTEEDGRSQAKEKLTSTPSLEVTKSSPVAERKRERRSAMQMLPTPSTQQNSLFAASNNSGQETHRHSFTVSPQLESHRNKEHAAHPLALMASQSVDFAKLPQWRSSFSQHVPLQNVMDGSELNDRLHTQAVKFKNTGCRPAYCKGSHMWPKEQKSSRVYGQPRTKEELLPLASDFITQYYDSKKSTLGNQYDEQLRERLSNVRSQIEEKGHYQLTYEELVFGARTAWRNAPRCVNRIIWRQLEILDAREARSPKEMYDAILHHIKYGTNEGNLRSTITVFQHRCRPNSDYRVWNPQLIRYAGYKQPDGSVMGDGANVEFTEVCKKLGWTPPSPQTAFDILPLVLQAEGGEAQWFEIPSNLVLEVPIRHPDYSKMETLGLKWYALPAVSNLMLDIGGLEFTACPFNGWYMCSEIARDLVEPARYNKLKDIAATLNLDTQKMKLWKDKAFVELNTAIMYSFQNSNVSIVDHHSATESFMTHIKAETKTRGGCPADWVWIVPPISGSLTPVFHQEMLLYFLSPSYEYQDDPWKHYHWPAGITGRLRERASSIKFKTLVETVRNVSKIFSAFYHKRVKATVLFATETGRSKNYACIVKDIFDKNFASKLVCMEDYNHANLEQEQLLLVVASTFGSGDPPTNGESFGRFLLDLRNRSVSSGPKRRTPRTHRLSSVTAPTPEMLEQANNSPLTQVKYAVFGLGSRAYPNFCMFAHTCDNLLKELGAEQIFPCGEGDELCGQEESFQTWVRECYEKACGVYKIDSVLSEEDLQCAPVYSNENYRIVEYEGVVPEQNVCADLKCVYGKDVYCPVLKNRYKLQSSQSNRSTIRVVVNTKGMPLQYQPGDHVAIYPHNNPRLVSNLLEALNLSFDPDKPLVLESKRKSSSGQFTWQQENRLPVPISLREAFTKYLDITNPPTPQLLKLLAQQAVRATDQEELLELAKGGNQYEDWKFELFPNILDVLNQFRSLKVNVTLLLHHLPLLQCRYYSISSSPKLNPDEVHITVAVVTFHKKSHLVGGRGSKHFGVCSTWLNRIEPGSVVPCFIRKAPAFHMPEEAQVPIIMVGPGTGIAPFRSFWQERIHQRNEALKSQVKSSQIQLLPKPEPKPQERRRRKTAYVAPVVQEIMKQEPVSQNPIPMRRSVSDTGDTSNLAEIVAARERALGRMTLYFGCRRSDMDFIYKDEMKKAHVIGALSDYHIAFSREPGEAKTYVQHLLKKNADSIVHQLMEERGHFYVCGDISMAADVCRTLQSILEDNAAMSANEARMMIDSMKENGLYHEDIFGVTLNTAAVTSRVRSAAKKTWRYMASAAAEGAKTPSTPFMRTLQNLDSPGSPQQLKRSLANKPQKTYNTKRMGQSTDSPQRQRRQVEHGKMTRAHTITFADEPDGPSPSSLSTKESTSNITILEPLQEQDGVGETLSPGLPPQEEAKREEEAKEEKEGGEEKEKGKEEKLAAPPAADESLVVLRGMTSEKKKIRRIRTNSKVQTEI